MKTLKWINRKIVDCIYSSTVIALMVICFAVGWYFMEVGTALKNLSQCCYAVSKWIAKIMSTLNATLKDAEDEVRTDMPKG